MNLSDRKYRSLVNDAIKDGAVKPGWTLWTYLKIGDGKERKFTVKQHKEGHEVLLHYHGSFILIEGGTGR